MCWARGTKSIETNIETVSSYASEAKWPDKFTNPQATLEYFEVEGRWEPNIGTVTLKCDDQVVGVCQIDVTQYVGQGQKTFRCPLQPADYSPDDDLSEVIFKGDTDMFPNAWLEFKITVGDNIASARQPSSTATSTRNSNANTALQGQINRAYEELRNEYEPRI